MGKASLEGLRALLDPLDAAAVECDGMTRLVVTRLAEAGIPCQAMLGTLRLNGQVVRPHFWVEVAGLLVDYRARLWLGTTADVPHGVFLRDSTAAVYTGAPVCIEPLPPGLAEIIAMPYPKH